MRDLIVPGYSDSRVIHHYRVRNWKGETASSKLTLSKRAVLSYQNSTKVQKNVDPVFKAPKSEDGSDTDLRRGRQEIMKVISALGGPVTS
jgi:hypothetical protein